MIKARLAEQNKVCLVFDTMQANAWESNGKVNGEGISHVLKLLTEGGVPTDCISAVCLCDVYQKGKAQDYKDKKEYIDELFATYGFNVLVPVGAEAFTRTVGFKGQQKYLVRSLESEVYSGQKVIPLQNPAQIKYDPSVLDTIKETIKLIKTQCEFPEVVVEKKLETHYTIIDTMAKFNSFVGEMMEPETNVIAYDLETTGLMFNVDEPTTIQFSHKPGYSFLIPCKTKGDYPAAPQVWSDGEWEYILDCLRALFADKSKTIVGHVKKFDDKFCYHHWGIPLQKENSWDTMIAAFLCDENSSNGLKDLACKYTDLGNYEQGLDRFKQEYCKKHKMKLKDFSYGLVPFEILAPYALTDTDATIRLYHFFKEELVKEEQQEPFRIIMRITWLLTRFELNGFPINVEYGQKLKLEMERDIVALKLELLQEPLIQQACDLLAADELAKLNTNRKKKLEALPRPFEFNLGSGPQKARLFFEVMKLKEVKKTKKGAPSTDKESLAVWCRTVPKHRELLQKISHYGELCKFLTTYVVGILSRTVNGRVHPTFNAVGARTGRTSCRTPNWQNIPARGDARKMKLVKAIKKMVEAPEGQLIVGADLSAIEMLWMAIASGDEKLLEIFRGDGLIHEYVTMELFDYIDCDPKDIKVKFEFERNSVAKRVQFLSIYGGGAETLARGVNESIIERVEMAKARGEVLKLTEFTKRDGQQILDRYFEKFSGVAQYMEDTTAFVLKHGYAVSPFGFRRRVPGVYSDDEGVKAQALRQAINQTIQNPASISLLLSMCNLQEEIDERGLAILLMGSIHDSGYQQVYEDDLIEGRDLLLKHMTAPPIPNCPVPVRAEAEWGRDWAGFSKDFGVNLTAELSEEDEDADEEDELEVAA